MPDHAGCLALLEWLEQCLPAKNYPLHEPSCDAIVAVLAAYVLPDLREVVTVCPRLAAAGIDTLNLERQMAARRRQLDERTGPPTG